jgi:diguanylate cyclase (GGDEF)-like protein/PAS domain S-box-containing protein
LDVLDTAPEPLFDTLTRLAKQVCNVPIALVSLVDAERQWFKAKQGLEARQTPRDIAFCAHAILDGGVMEVPDATLDPRFAVNPLVTGPPGIRFYAGAPIMLADGLRMGTLCVIDHQPRELSVLQRSLLSELAQAAAQALELRARTLDRALRAKSEFEQVLAGDNALLLRLLHGLPVGIALFDAQLAHRLSNPAARKQLAWQGATSAASAAAATLRDWVGPAAWPQHEAHAAGALQGVLQRYTVLVAARHDQDPGPGQGPALAHRVDDAAGLRHVQVDLFPNLGGDGAPDGVLMLLTDVTDDARRQAVEARYQAVVEDQSELISLARPDGELQFVNRAYAAHFGTTPEAMLGRSLYDYVAPAERPAVAAHLQAVLAGRASAAGENQMVLPDGQLRRVAWSNRALTDADGQVTALHSVGRDVTDRWRAEQQLRESQAFLDRTGRVAGIGGWEVDIASGAVHWSDQTCRIHDVAPGYRPTLSQAILFYAPEARPVINAAVEQAMQAGQGWDLELPLISATGRHLWARATGEAEFADGRPVRLVGAFQDITERKRVEAELAEQHELLSVTLKSIGDAVITTDAGGFVQWMNPVAERMTGWTIEKARGKALTQVFHIVHETTRQPAESPVARCLQDGHIAGLANHTLLIALDGREFGIEDSAAPIRDHAGRLLGVVLVFHDVSEQRRISHEMSFRASHDPLTGLVNRGEFELRLSRVLERAVDDGSANVLMLIDLDQFKLVNDACGHAVGDQLLCQVAQLLEHCVRTRDTLARLGGDEFGVVLEHCTVEQAQRVAQQVCDQMDEFRFLHDGRRFRIGASIGLVPLDARWSGIAPALQAADTACYAAKEAGRNRVHVWFDTDQAMRQRRGETQWASRLEQALDEDRFELYGQRIDPILPAHSALPAPPDRHKLHLEVLLRLRDTDGSIIAPGAFLPAAERFHMASRIDRWVLRHVFDWLDADGPARAQVALVAINLSGQSLGDRAFHRFVVQLLAESRVDPRQLCFEVTETAAITNLADATAFIAEVRALGVRIALDDFGAGASSFGYLKALPVDFLKIDGQFIRDLTTDPLDRAAVRCFH